jgi:potassium-transporting ATPase KdpC subunit
MKEQLKIALWFTLVTTVIFGIGYPLAVTGWRKCFFRGQRMAACWENSKLKVLRGRLFSSRRAWAMTRRIKPVTHKSFAGGRVAADLTKLRAENPGTPVPIDLVTASASGIDPDISPAAARFQILRIARARKISPEQLRTFVEARTTSRQFGIFGEPRVNVLELNRALDGEFPIK